MTTTEKKKTTKRVQVSNILGMSISSARVKVRVGKRCVDEEQSRKVKQLKDILSKVKEGKAPAEEKRTKEELDKLIKEASESIVRLGSTAPMTVTAVVDYAINELLRASFELAIKNKNSKTTNPTVTPAHLYEAAKKISTFPLFTVSKSFEEKIYSTDEEAKTEVVAAASASTTANGKAPLSSDEKKKASKEGFKTYIGNAIAKLKKDEANKDKFSNVRVSELLKQACDKFVREMIDVFSFMSMASQEVDGVRTLNDNHVKNAIKQLMLSRHKVAADYADLMDYVNEKLEAYEEYKRDTKLSKDEQKIKNLSPEEKKKYEDNKENEEKEKEAKEKTKLKEKIQEAEKKLANSKDDKKKAELKKKIQDMQKKLTETREDRKKESIKEKLQEAEKRMAATKDEKRKAKLKKEIDELKKLG